MDCKLLKNKEIMKTTNLGAGVTREDGKTVFISGALAGDVCDAIVTADKSSYALAEIEAILSPSPHRKAPDCEAFRGGCGGCTFRHASYEHELSVKEEYVTSLFRKAKLDVNVEPIRTAGENEPRTKVTLPVSGDGKLGYYRSNSHTVMPCKNCRLHDEETNAILALAEDLINGTPLGIHHITLRRATRGVMLIITSENSGDISLAKKITDGITREFPAVKSAFFHFCRRDEAYGKYTHIFGDDRISDTLTGCDFLISPASFYQVNHGGAEILYTLAKEFADLKDGESLADLYCGTGTIGLSVIKNSNVKASLFGIEIVPAAVADAKINAENNGIKADFITADAAVYDGCADVVIVDPPRAGCSKDLIFHLLKMAPERIVYISCDPATLVRDCKMLSEKYRVERAVPVDMFPRTGHCECAVKLVRI